MVDLIGYRNGEIREIENLMSNLRGSTEQSRDCSVSEKYIPPPERSYSGGFFEQFGKQILDNLVGGMIDEAMDNLANPKTPPASDTPSNMTVLPPAEAASAPATAQLTQSDDTAPTPKP